MYRISKEFSFEASHQLVGLQESHPCMRVHGHSYKCILEFKSETLKNGFVIDFRELDIIKHQINDLFDHRHLNLLIEQPTSENIAKFIFDLVKTRFPELVKVTIKETDKTSASYEE